MLNWQDSLILALETLTVGVLLTAVALGLMDIYKILQEILGHVDKEH